MMYNVFNNITNHTTELTAILAQRIVILDGAMGTMIQKHRLSQADYHGVYSEYRCKFAVKIKLNDK